MTMQRWRYFRNILILFLAFGVGWFTLEHDLKNPLNWLWVAPVLYLDFIVIQTFASTHPFRRRYLVPASPSIVGLTYEKVLFKSRDGLTLFGWYVPNRNRASLILVHGLGSMGLDMMIHAMPLVRAGFGVFMIDLRAHGSSDGNTSTYGRLEANDVAGAVDYLLTRADVDADKIGALGISLGAQAVLRGALKTDKLRAIVMEGLGPAVLADHGGKPTTLQRKINYPLNWFAYSLSEFMMGGRDTGVLEEIGKIAPRPLMLVACGKFEIHFGRMFLAAANDPKISWELPKTRHAHGLVQNPREYPQRIIAFFRQALDVGETKW
jgi:pimeloyl-ACP methyl ester carboxylesterase